MGYQKRGIQPEGTLTLEELPALCPIRLINREAQRPLNGEEQMKKLIGTFALSALLAVAGNAVAQDQPAASGSGSDNSAQHQHAQRQVDPQQQVEHMAKKLNLTADQKSQLLPILTARRDQMEGLRSDSSLSREDRHAKMQSIRTDSESKIRAVLTDNQKQTYDQMQQQMRERRQNHGAQANPAPSGN